MDLGGDEAGCGLRVRLRRVRGNFRNHYRGVRLLRDWYGTLRA